MNNPALQRVLSLFLCALMCATLLPVSALAESEATEGSIPEALNVEESVAEPAGDGALDVPEAVEEPALDPAEDGVPDVPETIEEPTEEPNEEQVGDGILNVPETIEEQEITEPPVTEETIADAAAAEAAPAEEEPEELVSDPPELKTLVVDVDMPGNLLDGYADKQLGSLLPRRPVLRAPKNVGGNLSGAPAVMYSQHKSIISQIAAGQESSTVITVSFSDLFNGKTVWTPEELGVDAPVTVIDNNGREVINSDAFWPTIYEMLDVRSVLTALLLDCPYELYWYDKTIGISYWSDGGLSTANNRTAIKLPSNFTIAYTVASAYRNGDAYIMNTTLGQQVQSAVSNAKAIVSAAASYSLLDKLNYYRQRICELVSYNDAAAAGGVAYGNPWQLIWVFDNDPDTNVVCEGYAKAFQYLCDLSDIGSATCYTVTGNMTYGTGAGNHMWNIVTMPDGKNYLVDITNCDTDSAGYPDGLFLKGCTGAYPTYSCCGCTYTYGYSDTNPSPFTEAELTLSATDYGVVDHTPGDVNGDGKVNNKDVLILMQYLKGRAVVVVENSTDINGDGKENNKDVLWLMRYIKYKNVVIH